jgi:hypothetical protein
MALIFLLAVFLFVVLAITAFVFPPNRWVKTGAAKKPPKKHD